MCVPDLGVPEPTEPQLDHGPVVQDLGQGVGVGYGVLQVGHQHQVTSLEPLVVDGMVVDVTQDGARPQPVGRVLGIHVLAQLVHQLQARLLLCTQLSLKIG